MKIIKLLNDENPYINLASEEFLLKYNKDLLNEDLFIVWKNKNTIVIGNSQNAYSEINLMYVNDNNINVVRRITGGGAVYHDEGNINFTFIKRNKRKEFKYQECLNEIIEFLNSLNIKASFSGRNDIVVDNKKVSGTAVTFYQNDYLIHGTLLFDVNVEVLVNCLTVDKNKLVSKGIESVKSRVANLKDYLDDCYDANLFEYDLIRFFEKKYQTDCLYISYKDNPIVKLNTIDKFTKYDYIFGKNYEFNFKNSIKLQHSLLSVNLFIENGFIYNLKFYTDSLEDHKLNMLERYFTNTRYSIDNIKNILNHIDLKEYFSELDNNNLIELLFKNN